MAGSTVISHMGADGRASRVERRPPARDDGLVAVIVEYPIRADRCTIYPARSDETERLTRWLSADRDAFESLARRR